MCTCMCVRICVHYLSVRVAYGNKLLSVFSISHNMYTLSQQTSVIVAASGGFIQSTELEAKNLIPGGRSILFTCWCVFA